MSHLVDANRARRRMEGADSTLHKDSKRRESMRCAVSATGRAGRMSRRDVVVAVFEAAAVVAAEVLASDLAAAGSAFAPSRRPS